MATRMVENPCNDLAQQSYKCLEKNQSNSKACQEHFDAYKACIKEQVPPLVLSVVHWRCYWRRMRLGDGGRWTQTAVWRMLCVS